MTGPTGLAAYGGTLVGLVTDPVIIVAGALLGLGAWTWWQRVLGSLVLAFALTFLVGLGAEPDGGLPAWWAMASRAIALFVWAAIGAVGRWVLDQLH